jgi:hypothetical protein
LEQNNETFDELIGRRWKESDFVGGIADGHQKGVFEKYGEALNGFGIIGMSLGSDIAGIGICAVPSSCGYHNNCELS